MLENTYFCPLAYDILQICVKKYYCKALCYNSLILIVVYSFLCSFTLFFDILLLIFCYLLFDFCHLLFTNICAYVLPPILYKHLCGFTPIFIYKHLCVFYSSFLLLFVATFLKIPQRCYFNSVTPFS